MTVTPDLIVQLRELIAEEIPAGGTESDTRFTDARLTVRLTDGLTLEAVAADLWEVKAGKFQAEIGKVKAVGSGQESMQWYSPQEQMKYCLDMAEKYRSKASGGSFGCAITKTVVIDDLDN